MQPRPVGTEEYLLCSSSINRLLEQIKSPDPGSVGVNVWVANQVIDERQLRAPIVGKTSQVGNDERDIRIFLGQQLYYRNLTHNVVDHWQRECPCGFAHFASDGCVVTMHLNTHEAVTRYGLFDHHSHAASIALGMNKSETVKAIWPA